MLKPSQQRLLSRLRNPERGLWVPMRDLWKPTSRCRLTYAIATIDEQGRMGRLKRRPAHSWNKAGTQFFNQLFIGAGGGETIKETDGTTNVLVVNADVVMIGAVGDLSSGIVVGGGVTAESNIDFVLATPFAEGTGVNQLNYSVGTVPVPVLAITGGYRTYVRRTVTNNSAASILVNEIALYGNLAAGGMITCLIRDVLASTETITVGTSRVIEYSFEFLN